MSKRFEKVFNSLYRGFKDGTIAKGTCTACAVGNIIADALGAKIICDHNHYTFECHADNTFWSDLFLTNSDNFQQKTNPFFQDPKLKQLAQRIKDLTSYSTSEMAMIEHAFEINTKIYFTTYERISRKLVIKDLYNGIVAVLEILFDIDSIENTKYYIEKMEALYEELLSVYGDFDN